ncbi:MAG: hypothetical protein MUF58_14410 [Arcicella sp.]|jgi:hypothetical protein|nr:hypothetical protein [Arcicella sp.]
MKKIMLITLQTVALATALVSCKDNCTQTVTYRGSESIKITLNELRTGVKTLPAQDLENPGKIYVKGNYLFINDIKKGIHVIDNTNPAAPRAVSFIQILGNIDIAVKDNLLYADSYTDLVTLDITNPNAVKEVSRTNEVFTSGQVDGIWWNYNVNDQTIYDARYKMYTVTQEVACEPQNPVYYGGIAFDQSFISSGFKVGSTTSTGGTNSGTGVGGSTARFTIVDDRLYAVTQNEMKLFDIKNAASPKADGSLSLGFGIETIFPYKNKLFIGTTTGVQIWDNANPKRPTYLSRLDHARACDPVVVENDIAYVTLRSVDNFTRCGAAIANQLDVIDVSNPSAPVLKKTYPMESPHGLGIDNKKLFICEGKSGLKYLDATNIMDIKQIQHFKDMNAYDVIPLSNTLMLIGKDGLYQYDYSNANALKLLSKISVKAAK